MSRLQGILVFRDFAGVYPAVFADLMIQMNVSYLKINKSATSFPDTNLRFFLQFSSV